MIDFRVKLNDLVYESTAPVYASNGTYFIDAYLPHDDFLSTAVTIMVCIIIL